MSVFGGFGSLPLRFGAEGGAAKRSGGKGRLLSAVLRPQKAANAHPHGS